MRISNNKTDFYTSVFKALEEIDKNFMNYPGLIITGSHDSRDSELFISDLKIARETNIPTLGICFGMQSIAIEWIRNELKEDANTTEVDPKTKNPVVIKLPELRVGIRPVIWGGSTRMESHWHNYHVNPAYRNYFREDWVMSETDGIVEVMRLKGHPFFCGIQFHPEYQSSKDNPHPLLKEFIKACKEKHTAEWPRA